MPQAVVLGGLVTDLVGYSPRFPVTGETLVAHGFEIGFGGEWLYWTFEAVIDDQTEVLAQVNILRKRTS